MSAQNGNQVEAQESDESDFEMIHNANYLAPAASVPGEFAAESSRSESASGSGESEASFSQMVPFGATMADLESRMNQVKAFIEVERQRFVEKSKALLERVNCVGAVARIQDDESVLIPAGNRTVAPAGIPNPPAVPAGIPNPPGIQQRPEGSRLIEAIHRRPSALIGKAELLNAMLLGAAPLDTEPMEPMNAERAESPELRPYEEDNEPMNGDRTDSESDSEEPTVADELANLSVATAVEPEVMADSTNEEPSRPVEDQSSEENEAHRRMNSEQSPKAAKPTQNPKPHPTQSRNEEFCKFLRLVMLIVGGVFMLSVLLVDYAFRTCDRRIDNLKIAHEHEITKIKNAGEFECSRLKEKLANVENLLKLKNTEISDLKNRIEELENDAAAILPENQRPKSYWTAEVDFVDPFDTSRHHFDKMMKEYMDKAVAERLRSWQSWAVASVQMADLDEI